MADVFISYAREDKEFVLRLHAALAGRQYAAWVDWEGIPPTADFLQEIHAAIDAADTVVLILSPDWAASTVCAKEATAALANNKRLVPVVCREVEPDQLTPAVAALNWIFCRDRDDFQQAFESLITAIETDLARVRALTRLLVRAREWDSSKREPSFLLHGIDLAQAEQLLTTDESAKPQPTALQREYVLASRMDAVKRQRRALAALSGGLAVAIVLAVLAFWQYRVAEERREGEQVARLEAEQKTRIATSQRLAAQADGALARFPQRSLLLAVEAVNVTLNNKEPIVADAQQSLRRALAELSGRGLGGAGAPLISVAHSADSRWLAASAQNKVYVWDLASPDRRPTVIDAVEGTVAHLIFAGGGQWLVGVTDKLVPVAWSLGSAKPRAAPFVVPEGAGRVAAVISLDGRRLLAMTEDNTRLLWDLTSPTPTANPRAFRSEAKLDLEELVFTTLLASADGRWLALKLPARPVQLWDLTAENPTLHPAELAGSDALLPELLISPDERWLLATGADHAVRLWDLTARDPASRPRVLRGHEDEISEATFSADGRWLVTGSNDRTARVWDLSAVDPTAGSIVLRGHGDMVRAISISADGRWILSSSLVNRLDPGGKFDTTAFLWDLRRGEPAANPFLLSGHERGIVAAKVTDDGRWAITASDAGPVRLWNLAAADPAAAPLVLRGQERRTYELSVTSDRRWLISHAEDFSVRIWDLLAPQSSATPLVFPGAGPGLLYPSPDSRWLGVSNFNAPAHLLDTAALNPAASDVPMPDLGRFSDPASAAFLYSTDSHWLVADGEYAPSRLFDLTGPVTAASARALTGDGGGEQPRKAISADNRWLVKIQRPRDTEARLWSLSKASSEPLVLRGHTEAIAYAVISANSHWLATASDDATVRLWNLQTADPSLAPIVLKGHAKRIASCVFSPDSRWLVTTSDEGIVQLWELAEGKPPRATPLPGYTTAVRGVTFSPNARWLITSSGDEPARLWDLQSARPETTSRKLPEHAARVESASFSPDSRWMVTLDGERLPHLWDLQAENPSGNSFALGGHEHGVGFLAISNDSRWLATAGAPYATSRTDTVIRLWDLKLADPSKAPLVLLGHERGVAALAMSADSRWLISGSEDTTLRIWDLRATNPANAPMVLSGHRGPISRIAVSPDSRWIASASDKGDSDVRLWYLQSADLLTLARRTAGRNLDLNEWSLFFAGQPYRRTFVDFPAAEAPPKR